MLGLTLEGGGAKGSYQIGAWKAFRELGIEFQGITGTSVGALNGALILQDEFERAYEIWSEMTPTTVMNIDDRIYEILSEYHWNSKNINLIFHEISKVVKGLGIDARPLEELVNKMLQEDKIRSSPVDFGFVTVCLTDFKPLQLFKEEIPLNKMAEYLIASSYLPIFKSKKLDGKVFLDGGFYNNLPIDMLYSRGYRKIIAVRLLSKGRIKRLEYPDLEVICIHPVQNLGNMMDFTKERARYNIQLGYFDTLRVFKNFKGKNYYFYEGIEEGEALKFLMNLSEESIKKLGNLYNLPPALPLNRLLLEGIIPKLAYLMEVGIGATYEEIVLSMIEAMASYGQVNLLEVYSPCELLRLSQAGYEEQRRNKEEGLIDILKRNDLVLRLKKEMLLEESIKIILAYNRALCI